MPFRELPRGPASILVEMHLRSAFEAELSILYILRADCERRALAYHVKEARERLNTNDKYDIRTDAGKKIREEIKNDLLGTDILASLPAYDFDAENKELRHAF